MSTAMHSQTIQHNGGIRMGMVLVTIIHTHLVPMDCEQNKQVTLSQPIHYSIKIQMAMVGATSIHGLMI